MEAVNKQKGMNGNVKEGIQDPNKAISQIDGAQMPVEGEKMSFLKKWWFWAAIGAVIVLGILFFLFL
jgi:hypothetical protein